MSVDPKAAENIVQILANLPDFLRKPMLVSRLKEFYSMSDADRHETVAVALKASPSIEVSKLSALAKTWLEVLSEFDADKRTTMFSIYCEEVLKQPEVVEKLDIRPLADSFISLGEQQKEKIIDSVKETILTQPSKNELLKIMPPYLLQILQLK